MTRSEAWLVHLANLLVGGTGLAWVVVGYLLEPVDPFAAVHPWQPPVQHAHVWVAPLLVFAVGAIWRSHALTGWRLGAGQRRASGVALIGVFVPMTASGYFLQTAVDPAWRRAWLVVHLIAATLWLLAALAHLFGRRRPR